VSRRIGGGGHPLRLAAELGVGRVFPGVGVRGATPATPAGVSTSWSPASTYRRERSAPPVARAMADARLVAVIEFRCDREAA